MTTKEVLYQQIRDAVVAFEEEKVGALAQQSLDEGYDPVETIFEGLSAGMNIVGELFETHAYFVPEVLMCADALQVGMDILQPHIPKEGMTDKGQVVLGTVQGDVHDIGKNIVKLMLDVGGFTVHDLGKDVPLQRFVEEVNPGTGKGQLKALALADAAGPGQPDHQRLSRVRVQPAVDDLVRAQGLQELDPGPERRPLGAPVLSGRTER